jgi:hypothetical protein
MTRNFFEHSPLTKVRRLHYLLDISPLDFYRFGKIQSALIWSEIPDEIDLLEIVSQMLDDISDEELQAVLHS